MLSSSYEYRPLPGQEVPDLNIDVLSGRMWNIKLEEPDFMTMIVFYRGLHCPICKKYLEELNGLIDQFKDLGVNVIAISTDKKDNAMKSADEWDVNQIELGYGMRLDDAKKWGLYLSSATKEEEPEYFSEPGVFLVQNDGVLYASNVQSMPFARPHFDDILQTVKYVKEKNYPARGIVPEVVESQGQGM